MNSFDKYIKGIVAIAVNLGIADASDIELANTITGGMIQAGFGIYMYPLISGSGVYILGSLREQILEFISDIDPDDSLHIQGLFSFFEDCFGIFAPIMLFILPPLLILIFTGTIFLFIYLINKYFQTKDDATKIKCSSCGHLIFPSAAVCFNCNNSLENIQTIDFFGMPKNKTVVDLSAHKLNLLEKKRCSSCASRLTISNPKQHCEVCNQRPFKDIQVVKDYLARISSRLILVLIITTILGFIPIIGAIIGIIYYRIALISPFVRYTSTGEKIILKWTLKIISFIILMFQWIPFFGAVCLPIIVLLNYYVYFKSFKKVLLKKEEK